MTDATLDERPAVIVQPEPTLWVTDAELLRRLGVPENIGYKAIRSLDNPANKHLRFPQKSPLWGHRRYWPAVKEWMDHDSGLKMPVSATQHRRTA